MTNEDASDGKFHLTINKSPINPTAVLSFDDWESALDEFEKLKDSLGYVDLEDIDYGRMAVKPFV